MDVFAALADPVRRGIVQRLAVGPTRVVDLTADHKISRPAISKHLRLLTEAGVVEAEDRGRERHYRLVPLGLAPVQHWLDALVPAPPVPAHALDGLELEVHRVGRDRKRKATPTTSTEETA